jgi:hypothetical protein
MEKYLQSNLRTASTNIKVDILYTTERQAVTCITFTMNIFKTNLYTEETVLIT